MDRSSYDRFTGVEPGDDETVEFELSPDEVQWMFDQVEIGIGNLTGESVEAALSGQADRPAGEVEGDGEGPSPIQNSSQLGSLGVAGEGVHQGTNDHEQEGKGDGHHAPGSDAGSVPGPRFGERLRAWRAGDSDTRRLLAIADAIDRDALALQGRIEDLEYALLDVSDRASRIVEKCEEEAGATPQPAPERPKVKRAALNPRQCSEIEAHLAGLDQSSWTREAVVDYLLRICAE